MQINRCLHISSSVLGIPPSLEIVQKKNRAENFTFIGTNNWIVLAVQWSVKYIFASNSPISWKSCAEERENSKALCFASKCKKVKMKTFTALSVISTKNLKILKYHIFLIKQLFCDKCWSEEGNINQVRCKIFLVWWRIWKSTK